MVDIDDSDVPVGIEEIWLAQGGVEGELLAVGREDGIVIGRIEADDEVDLVVVSEIGDVDVLVGAESEQGSVVGGEGDEFRIGRPVEVVDG